MQENKNFDIAIVIPSFNEENYIEECLDSIVNQTHDFSKIEVLVCDGKSIDKTQEKVTAYSNKYNNIKVIGPTAQAQKTSTIIDKENILSKVSKSSSSI